MPNDDREPFTNQADVDDEDGDARLQAFLLDEMLR